MGFFITDEEVYHSEHYASSLRIKGLIKGVNKNTRERNVVIHESPISERISAYTEGCFGVHRKDAADVVSLLAGGAMIYAHSSLVP